MEGPKVLETIEGSNFAIGHTHKPCEHVRNTDPRFVNQCVKCGAGLAAVPVIERNAAYEKQLIEHACESVGLPHLADSIVALVSKRIFDGPVQMPPGRDLIREWFEEVADGFAYGAFKLQQLMDEGEPEGTSAKYLQEALRHSVLTFAALRKAGEN